MAVLVGQVYFDPRNVIAVSTQGSLNCTADLSSQCLATFNVVVGVDLNLHRVLLLSLGFFFVIRHLPALPRAHFKVSIKPLQNETRDLSSRPHN